MEEAAKKITKIDDRTAEIAAAFIAGIKFAERADRAIQEESKVERQE